MEMDNTINQLNVGSAVGSLEVDDSLTKEQAAFFEELTSVLTGVSSGMGLTSGKQGTELTEDMSPRAPIEAQDKDSRLDVLGRFRKVIITILGS